MGYQKTVLSSTFLKSCKGFTSQRLTCDQAFFGRALRSQRKKKEHLIAGFILWVPIYKPKFSFLLITSIHDQEKFKLWQLIKWLKKGEMPWSFYLVWRSVDWDFNKCGCGKRDLILVGCWLCSLNDLFLKFKVNCFLSDPGRTSLRGRLKKEEGESLPPFFPSVPSSLSPAPFDPGYAGLDAPTPGQRLLLTISSCVGEK